MGWGCDIGARSAIGSPNPDHHDHSLESPSEISERRFLNGYGKNTIFKQRPERPVVWAPGTREALRQFPDYVSWSFGRALFQVQKGGRPSISKPLRGDLRGVFELREKREGDAYRLYYTLKCRDLVCVLLCHKKKSSRGKGIPRHEKDLIVDRFKACIEAFGESSGGLS
jgi:phage-related protein